jgi:hypothetical protein
MAKRPEVAEISDDSSPPFAQGRRICRNAAAFRARGMDNPVYALGQKGAIKSSKLRIDEIVLGVRGNSLVATRWPSEPASRFLSVTR